MIEFAGRSMIGGSGGNKVKKRRGVVMVGGDGADAEPGKGTEIEPGTEQEMAEWLQFFSLFKLMNNYTPLLINHIYSSRCKKNPFFLCVYLAIEGDATIQSTQQQR